MFHRYTIHSEKKKKKSRRHSSRRSRRDCRRLCERSIRKCFPHFQLCFQSFLGREPTDRRSDTKHTESFFCSLRESRCVVVTSKATHSRRSILHLVLSCEEDES